MTAEKAFEKKISDVALTAKGKVSRILEDDHEGAHHQRFIVKVSPTQTILIAHNLERAYRAPIKVGDKVEVHGTYVWNRHGGIIHNTHHDDRNACERDSSGKMVCGPKHEDGWIVFVGKKSPHRTKNLPS
jgi:hypothetical protein